MYELFFEPWIGHKYEANRERLLILGESHYGLPSTPGNHTIALTHFGFLPAGRQLRLAEAKTAPGGKNATRRIQAWRLGVY